MYLFRYIALIVLPASMTKFVKSFSDSASTLPLLQKMPKLILVDRDGVVNEDVGSPGVLDKAQLVLTPGAGLALGRFRRAGCKIALITNQSCVGKGLITEEYLLHNIHQRLEELLLDEDEDAILDHIFYCTSLKTSNDHRLKPNPGMIEEALKLFGIKDPCDAIFIGDALRDMEAAARANISNKILVATGYGRGIMGGENAPNVDGIVRVVTKSESNIEYDKLKPSIFPFFYANNLFSAMEWVLNTSKENREDNKMTNADT